MIQREISRVLVLNLSGENNGEKTPREKFVLDSAFALIEGTAAPGCPVERSSTEVSYPLRFEQKAFPTVKTRCFAYSAGPNRNVPQALRLERLGATSELPVIRPESKASAEITSYKPTSQDR